MTDSEKLDKALEDLAFLKAHMSADKAICRVVAKSICDMRPNKMTLLTMPLWIAVQRLLGLALYPLAYVMRHAIRTDEVLMRHEQAAACGVVSVYDLRIGGSRVEFNLVSLGEYPTDYFAVQSSSEIP